MKIILKPAGIVFLLIAVATMCFLAFRKSGSSTSVLSQSQSQNQTTPLFALSAPLKTISFPTKVAEGWQLSGEGKTLEKTDTSSGECPFPEVTLAQETGELQVKVACHELAPGATYPKYGLRVKGAVEGDELDAWIDPQAKVLTTRGKVGSTNYDWHASPLPDGFDTTKEHTLIIQWSGGGKEWKFLIDNDRHSAQSKHLFAQMQPASALVMNYLSKPSYRELATR